MLEDSGPMRIPTTRLRAAAASRLARNARAMFVGQMGKIALQGAYFVILARALGISEFGAFAGTVALVALATPFASLGALNLMLRGIVQEPQDTARHFATALRVTVTGGAAMTAILVVTSPWIAPPEVGMSQIAMIAVADLLGARLVDVAGGVHAALEQMARTAAFQLWFNSVRAAGALALWASPWTFSLGHWSAVYLITSALPAIVILRSVQRDVGRAAADMQRFKREWKDGALFSLGLASQSIYNDIDKAMLARLSTLEATGIYTAAYRIVDMAFTPMRAMLAAAYPRFFAYGGRGLRPVLGFTRRIALPGVGYSLAASVGLLLFADVVPVILGEDYEPAVAALRALAVLPLFKAIHYLAADSLTGANHQRIRSAMQLTIAAVNVVLNAWLIPAYDYWGAVVASLLSDGLLAVLLWAVIAIKIRREPRAPG